MELAGKDQVKPCGLVVVMAMVTDDIADNSVAVKRRKLGNEKLNSPTFVETKSIGGDVHVNSLLSDKRNGCNCNRSGCVTGSSCSSTGSIEKILKVSDLEESVDDQSETNARNNLERIPCELESTVVESQSTVMNTSRRKVEKMPPEAELEEFFASAQKDLNKRFKNKYNYDIVNDIPLEGRFEWIQVNQEK